MPFFEAVIKNRAASHLVSGSLERSNTVPTVTVNCWRHSVSLHLYTPGRWALPSRCVSLAASALPQCGQFTPFAQTRASSHSRALVSSWKMGFLRRCDMGCSDASDHAPPVLLCQGYNSEYKTSWRRGWDSNPR